jgi:ubiquinone/menaquinone biosynthesis C-methylase UbiE
LPIYSDRVLPGLIHLAMRQERLMPLRQRVACAAHGRVLELGIGSGLNLPLYDREVTGVVGVDPAARLLERARSSAAWMPFPVTLIRQSAEHLPFDSRSFDCAVTTWCLCSIADPLMALGEVRRVLKPGGDLLFVEHGRSGRPCVRRWQERLSPAWQRLAGGCRLDRPMSELIRAAGFRLTSLEAGPLVKAPAILAWHYLGRAQS